MKEKNNVIAVQGIQYIELFNLETEEHICDLTRKANIDLLFGDHDSKAIHRFKLHNFKFYRIYLNEDLYNTAIKFHEIQDSIIRDIFIKTIKNLMYEE